MSENPIQISRGTAERLIALLEELQLEADDIPEVDEWLRQLRQALHEALE